MLQKKKSEKKKIRIFVAKPIREVQGPLNNIFLWDFSCSQNPFMFGVAKNATIKFYFCPPKRIPYLFQSGGGYGEFSFFFPVSLCHRMAPKDSAREHFRAIFD